MKFSKGVLVRDTVTGRVVVESVREDKPICTLEVEVINQKGEICLSGTTTTYTMPLKKA
ncbi:hypothetical protein [Caballeronia sp. LZ035]|uniref:hypothetical protein n=1 Tax=Caballeronia sp. LZ035 TaxID=3038568 RepID=UPI00285E1DA0|nr:hypothetical protein [Caballeronia sp. LZ035]MDR5761413.1 hypothetical protein [Caballeronia sp. LZ035]